MDIARLLKAAGIEPAQAIPFDINTSTRLNLSKDNEQLWSIDLNNADEFSGFINEQIEAKGAEIGWGGYQEERGLYSRSELFEEEEPRTIHLGIDIWMAAGTEVFAPLAGEVHSFDNRMVHGDYGPVIILKHEVKGTAFHTLYGHLSTTSLEGLKVGQRIEQGERFASLGRYEENFHWPPHLHFQVIVDMQGNRGDYPGVCRASERDYYFNNCPDPSVLLGL